MSLIDKALRAFRGSKAAAPSGVQASYMRGGRHTVFSGWNPLRRTEQQERGISWDAAVARTADAIHNSGWLSGAIEQSIANTVGLGLRVRPAPENAEFGMSDDEARAWAARVERRWELWANNPLECDVAGQRTVGMMQAAAYASWLATGEALGEIVTRRRAISRSLTKVRLMMPTRLSRRDDPMRRLINGIFTDADGMPVAVLAKVGNDRMRQQEVEVPIRDALGRPRVIHVFTGPAETYRGITPLAPALQVIRQFDQLADATLTTAIVQTLFAASIKSPEDVEEAMKGILTERERNEMLRDGSAMEAYLEASGAFYEGASIDLGVSGRLAKLFPGDELAFHSAKMPGDNYEPFSADLKRQFARCLGMLYESATGDYSNATYASLGRGLAEIHEVTKYRRAHVLTPFTKPVYDAWLEEEVERGTIDFPGGIAGFIRHRAAATRMVLAGGARPIAEDLKTARAHDTWLKAGVISRTQVAHDLGHDFEDVIADLARERDLRAAHGLPEPEGALGSPETDDDDEEDDDDRDA